jgi:hypothetical protein
MAEYNFLARISQFANTAWPSVRIGHSIGAWDEKYPCANPEGPVDNSGCSDPESPDYDPNNPLCKCPCQELNPFKEEEVSDVETFGLPDWMSSIVSFIESDSSQSSGGVAEPTNEQIRESVENIKECDLIGEVLGNSWKGCLWGNQEHPSSCDCPCVGEDFGRYIEFTRTSSTYWETIKERPLWRDAQLMLIGSQSCEITIGGDLSLRPGTIINIFNDIPDTGQGRRSAGRWLVTSIKHQLFQESHTMTLSLSRDSSPIDPNDVENLDVFPSDLL